MGKLSLSSQMVKGIEIINSLNKDQLNGIIQYIKNMPLGEPGRNVIEHFKSNLGIEEAEFVFRSLIALVNFYDRNKNKDALDDILESHV